MADPTRRQIAMMADEVGITDYPAADRLVRRAFEVSRSARAALAEPAPPAAGEVGEGVTDEELGDLWSWAAAQDQGPWPTQQHCFARAVLARWGHQPAPPADDCGVLPMIISETGADDEPEIERITCAWISGGADYVNNMPRKLGLERTTPRGSIFADYVQVEPDTRVALAQPVPPAAGEVGELSVVHATAPERIWLYLNGANEYLPFRNEDDVVWSPDPIDSSDIPYVRADLLTQRHPEPAPVSEPVAWLWEYIGSDPYPDRFSPVARSLREMDPANPPFPDSWRPVAPLYALPLPAGEVE